MDDEVVVEVEPQVEDETPDVEVTEGDTTVVVETPATEETHSEELAVTVGRLTAEVEQMRIRLEETVWKTEEAQATADVALDAAVTADETAEDVGTAVEEVAEAAANPDDESEREDIAVEDDTKDSILPSGKHWWHKSWREIAGAE